MKFLDDAFQNSLSEILIKNNLTDMNEENLDNLVSESCNGASDEISKFITKELLKNAKETLKEHKVFERGFIKRNTKRWQKALDLFEVHINVNQEIANIFLEEHFDELFKKIPYKIQALSLIQARALLVSRESLALIKNGYADGALARWRSLHELAIASQFLAHHEDVISKRYFLSFEIIALKAMRQYQEYHQRAGLHPYKEEEIIQKEEICAKILQEYGTEMQYERGWASPVIGGKQNPTWFDLEKNINLDHMRPYYAWASHTIHAGFKPPQTFLGACEIPLDQEEPLLLAGASNSGLTDPIGLVPISLQQVTGSLIFLKETFSSIVSLKIIMKINKELQEALKEIELKQPSEAA